MGTVYYGRITVEVCDACCAAHAAGAPWEIGILQLDPFGTDEMHIEMDDGLGQPLCKAAAPTKEA